ncbi:MAG: hypothetical protein CR988_02310 [Treponema sp.]|nr:MAG: hypothetical protein CR988_02310 [Treponema sp.]
MYYEIITIIVIGVIFVVVLTEIVKAFDKKHRLKKWFVFVSLFFSGGFSTFFWWVELYQMRNWFFCWLVIFGLSFLINNYLIKWIKLKIKNK